ncbi:MAG: lysyl-tRNA synthetase, class [Solirubrobacterales bacterium]|jgi:lysyl-tRNA synthetase|nr:lysyl-tRNA synthetase, class [Solirubrobacterales bacterium]
MSPPEANDPVGETGAEPAGAERPEFQEQTRAHRLEKLERLRERGIEPYPVRFDRDSTAAAIRDEFPDLAAGTDTGKLVRLAGRVMGERRHGGLDFADLQDESGRIQLMATRDAVGADELHGFSDLDLGDWIGVEGTVIASDRGELTVRVAKFELLSKSLRALPDVRRGVSDPETRYRRRYLDLTLDEDSRRVFRIRSSVIATTRRVLTEKGFTEVETPVLLGQAGGAAAKPFVTHHNALDIDLTLRIALELPLKRLIVGGMNRVFEIGRVFRNEGLDTRHNPEFTLLEAYQAFGDYHDMMDLTEAIIAAACEEAIGTTVVRIGEREVDLKPPWRRATMAELIKENAGVEMHPSMPVEEARKIADERGVEYLDVWGSGKIISEVYDDSSESKLIEPTFVIDHPREVSPLARAHRDDPELTERFELVVAGRELANAYSELNDPVDQAERFQTEADLQAGGDEEGEPVDEDYVKALEYGLPPTGGLGIGIDRLVMLISGAEAIRDVILFPTLRPEGQEGADGSAAVASDGAPSAEAFGAPGAEENDDDVAAAERSALAAGAALPPPAGRARSLRPLAWLSLLVAIFSLLPTATSIRFSLGHLGFVHGGGRSAGLIASVAIGLGIIAVARGLSRGKRRAWAVAVILFVAASIVHLIHGPDPISVVLSVAMLSALLWFRQDFRAQGDPGSFGQAAIFVPLYLAFAFAFTSVTLFAERAHVSPDLTFWGNVETAFKGMVGLDGPYAYGREVFGDFFEITLIMLGVIGLLSFLYLLLRTFVQAEPPSAERRRKAEEIVRRWGDDTLDYFALRRDKNYFFSSDGRSLIAYLYVRGTAMVAADPIGPAADTARTLDEFLGFCAERGWRVAFFAVRESDADLYRERGMHPLYLGDEAIVHPDRFTLEGAEMKAARSAVKHVSHGHGFELIAETEASQELIAELNEISAEWRDGSPERGFTMELGEEVEGTNPDFVIAVAKERGGRVAGFLRFVPVYGEEPGYSLDLMRRRPDSANGLTEFLISEAALALGSRGFKRLSLNFAAWGRLLDSAEGAGLGGKLQRLMAKGLNPFFQIQSLRDFNQKFDPEWVPRSVVIEDVSDLPRVAMLYASVEGFLDVPVLGRALQPPIRRAEADAPSPAGAVEVSDA